MGAKLFVPFTLEQLDDLYAVGLELEGHHILALSSDKRAIEEALTPVRRTAQPRVSAKHGAARGLHPTPGTSSSSGSPDTTIGDTSIDNVANDAVLEVVRAIRTDSSLGYPEYQYPQMGDGGVGPGITQRGKERRYSS